MVKFIVETSAPEDMICFKILKQLSSITLLIHPNFASTEY